MVINPIKSNILTQEFRPNCIFYIHLNHTMRNVKQTRNVLVISTQIHYWETLIPGIISLNQ